MQLLDIGKVLMVFFLGNMGAIQVIGLFHYYPIL